MKVSIIVLVFNEIKGMKVVLPRIKGEWYDELIIADGGSADGSFEYAQKQGYQVFKQKGKGYSAAFTEAIERATGDIIIFFSSDGNSLPEKIPELVNKMKEGYDIVIVSRYLGGARSYDDDVVTAFGNRLFTGLVNLLFGAKITDSLNMYRAYKRNTAIELKKGPKTRSTIETQILLRAIKKKLKIGEIPGDEFPRIGGLRKMHPFRDGFNVLMTILKEFFIRKF
jgi:glycosyltransferase involved in cell wall biosynthesis